MACAPARPQLPSAEWVTPVLKMGVDQTAWSLFWNTTYYVLLGALKLESPGTIAQVGGAGGAGGAARGPGLVVV